jgi:hypothetical protein
VSDRRDVLIHAAREDILHKHEHRLDADEVAFWTVNGTPRHTGPGATIAFADGDVLIATGEIVDVTDGRIWFDELTAAAGAPPEEPPTRGFTYTDLDGGDCR